jgi:hypothetical protein
MPLPLLRCSVHFVTSQPACDFGLDIHIPNSQVPTAGNLHRKTDLRKYPLASETIGARYGGPGVAPAPDRLDCEPDQGKFDHGNAPG